MIKISTTEQYRLFPKLNLGDLPNIHIYSKVLNEERSRYQSGGKRVLRCTRGTLHCRMPRINVVVWYTVKVSNMLLQLNFRHLQLHFLTTIEPMSLGILVTTYILTDMPGLRDQMGV